MPVRRLVHARPRLGSLDGEAVVVRGDLDPCGSARSITGWLDTAVPRSRQLAGAEAESPAEQLIAGSRCRNTGFLRQGSTSRARPSWSAAAGIAWAVGEEHPNLGSSPQCRRTEIVDGTT